MVGTLGFGLALVSFSATRQLWLSFPLLVLAGLCMIVSVASANTMLQTLVADDKRGRVMSLFAMGFQGMMPIGSLIAGTLAEPEHLGVPWTVAIGGVAVVAAGVVFALQLPRLSAAARPLLEEKGLVPPVAKAVEAATIKSPAAGRN